MGFLATGGVCLWGYSSVNIPGGITHPWYISHCTRIILSFKPPTRTVLPANTKRNTGRTPMRGHPAHCAKTALALGAPPEGGLGAPGKPPASRSGVGCLHVGGGAVPAPSHRVMRRHAPGRPCLPVPAICSAWTQCRESAPQTDAPRCKSRTHRRADPDAAVFAPSPQDQGTEASGTPSRGPSPRGRPHAAKWQLSGVLPATLLFQSLQLGVENAASCKRSESETPILLPAARAEVPVGGWQSPHVSATTGHRRPSCAASFQPAASGPASSD